MLSDQLGRERRLRGAMLPLEGDYDLVIIDAAPTMGLVTINVVNYVRELLVPVDAGLYSVAGLGRLQETVTKSSDISTTAVRIAGLVLTRAHNNRATKDIEGQLREAFGDLVHQAVIPHSVRVEEAHARHRTILEFAPRSAPALAYDRLITEVLGHGESTGDSESALHADQADNAA